MKVENGFQFDISTSLDFNSSRFSECSNGTISFTNQTLVFDYACEGFSTGVESPPGSFAYNFKFIDSTLELTLSFIGYFEGCGERFKKIAEPQTGD